MEILTLVGGAVVTLLVNVMKKKYPSSGLTTVAVTAVVSLAAAIVFALLSYYGVVEAFKEVFTTATMIYAVILNGVLKK